MLLKNAHNLLPLKKNLKSIAVIGPMRMTAGINSAITRQRKSPSLWSPSCRESSEKVGPQTKGALRQRIERAGRRQKRFREAVQAAKGADLAVVVVGEQFGITDTDYKERIATDGEGSDVASLDLTGVQEELVQAVSATGTPVVVVLINGRPLSVRWEAAHVPALVEAWEPGELGGTAVADVLFGDYFWSGRLAITIPRSAAPRLL